MPKRSPRSLSPGEELFADWLRSRPDNEAGQLVMAYKVFRCWVSEFQAQPDLDANANAIAIQTIKLENEGWERDYAVVEPAEPSFVEPA